MSEEQATELSVQLWTVREQLSHDSEATLRALGAIGYRQIELMDVCGTRDLLPVVRDLGLVVRSAFFDWNTVLRLSGTGPVGAGRPEVIRADRDGFLRTLEAALEWGVRYLVFGYLRPDQRGAADDYRRLAACLNLAGELAAKAGIELNYHNHAFEFQSLADGLTPMDILVARLDPQWVRFELDIFWCQMGGRDALDLLRSIRGRVAQIHLKDGRLEAAPCYDESSSQCWQVCELGQGGMDIAAVVTESVRQGIEQFHVEQDWSDDPLKSLAESLRFWRRLVDLNLIFDAHDSVHATG